MASHDLERDILESDAAFRASFDRSSATYHGGSAEPVPLGGARVPEGADAAPSVQDSRAEVIRAMNALRRHLVRRRTPPSAARLP